MKRRHLAGAGLIVAAVAIALSPPHDTLASWSDTEYTRGSFTTGSVSAPTNLQCSAGLLSPPHFTWTAPVGGLTRSGYTWSLSGAFTGGGTLGATATDVTVSGGLLSIGSGTFHLYANGPGGWKSTEVTGSLGIVTGLLYFCSVP